MSTISETSSDNYVSINNLSEDERREIIKHVRTKIDLTMMNVNRVEIGDYMAFLMLCIDDIYLRLEGLDAR